MAMRLIFQGFCINRFCIGPLHYLWSRSDFGFKFPERDIRNQKTTPWLSESGSRRFSDCDWVSQRVANSPTRWVGESPTRLLNVWKKTHSLVTTSRGVVFYYKYLREFEAKIGMAWKVVLGIHEEPIYAKKTENPPHCHAPLIIIRC